ncbi:MAG: uroporphyrinogen-III C-methyltransferase [Gammaproteobacteria bacterium]|nr:uroporphyrinogen-III C-methyltransferase [Gammaproteobacteria bacterium]
MSTDPGSVDTRVAAPTDTRARRGKAAFLGLLSLVLSVAALLAVFVLYEDTRQKEALSDTRRAETDRLVNRIDRLERDLDQSRLETRQLRDALTSLERKESAAAQAIAGLLASSRQTNLDWALAEVEHLLVIATQRLQLLHDVPTALAAMESAAARLRHLDDPGLDDLRAQLAADIDALKAVRDVDISGLALYLTDLSDRVDSLPLGGRSGRAQGARDRGEAGAQSGWRGLLSSIWREFKSLVVVSRTGAATGATLLPEEQYFLFQNLRLQIETARLAVARRDMRMLHAALATLDDWLRSHFDTSSADVANVLDSFKRMQQLDLDPELPDITSSMETLRAFVHERAVEGAVPDSAAPQP